MSEVELQAQLDNANNMLKVSNAKHSAANHSLGVALAESNDVKAANILYQEREKELMSKCQELEFKVKCLESKIVELENELSELKKPQENAVEPVHVPKEEVQADFLEL